MRTPKILIIPDTPGWAWDIKSKYLRRWLSDEFRVSIVYATELKGLKDEYDIYMTYTPHHNYHLKHIDRKKKITGVTGAPCYERLLKEKDLNEKVVALHVNCKIFQTWIKDCHRKVYYTPNGVDCKLFKMSRFPRKKLLRVGFVGKPLPDKGVNDMMLPAIKKCAGVEFIPKFSNHTNADPHDRLPDYYKDIDVYLVASKTEGTPNPALEAAASGRPIIANKVGNMPEFVKNGVNGFLVERKVDAYVEKLTFLKNNRYLMEAMGTEAREKAMSWDWYFQVEAYRKMFREVLKNGS